LLVARRELSAYLKSPLGYVVAAAALLIDGIYFQVAALGSGARLSAEVLLKFLDGTAFITMVAALILSMRLIAGERESGTLILLKTAPVRDGEIIVGKFLAALALVTLMTAITIYMPLLIFVNGKVSVGHILVGYSGVLLLGAASLAIGLFASTLTTVPVGAMAATVVLAGVSQVLDQLPQLDRLHPFLFSHLWLGFGDLLRDPIAFDSFGANALLQLGWVAVFGALAYGRFATKDVLS
jgi:ABC-2 type transport system permease protein